MRNNKMTVFGLVVTILYVGFILVMRWSDIEKLATIELNALGDFLAGVFGPLTLFWLILGYVQQQKELKQNTSALELQAQELSNSVVQYKHLVEASQAQLESDKREIEAANTRRLHNARPKFIFSSTGWEMKSGLQYRYRFDVINVGGDALNVIAVADPMFGGFKKAKTANIVKGGEWAIKWQASDIKTFPVKFKITIYCSTGEGEEPAFVFYFRVQEDGRYELINE